MKGTITIRVTENGYGVETDLEDVSLQNKLECMHNLAVALEMNDADMLMYFLAEECGVLKDAAGVIQCGSDEEMDNLLYGGKLDES